MSITLAPLGPEDLPRVARIRVAPEQEVYSGTVDEAFAEDPARFDLHAIHDQGDPVGLFRIDRDYRRSLPLAFPAELGLRGFMIDRDRQGQGLATRAVRALKPYLRQRYPDAPSVALTVNHSNPAALACYLNGGFRDTGIDWPEGNAGPQDVLRMELRPLKAPEIPTRTGQSAEERPERSDAADAPEDPDPAAPYWRRQLASILQRTKRHVPPGLRLVAGLLLIVGGVFGFLPVLGFWMIPLGIAVALLDIRPLWRKFSGRS